MFSKGIMISLLFIAILSMCLPVVLSEVEETTWDEFSEPCGKTPIEPVGEVAGIVGGQVAKPGSFPWQVGLVQYLLPNQQLFCGGSIISQEWVLTAAHCIVDKKTNIVRANNTYNVKVDVFDYTKSGVEVKVNKGVAHPNFRFGSGTNKGDIALIKLAKPLTYSNTVQPVCLPYDDTEERKEGTKMTVTGWGRTATTEAAFTNKVLKQATIAQINPQNCPYSYLLCFPGLSSGQSAFQGDSGSPLVRKRNDFYQFGLVSGGGTTLSKYTRISEHCDWIESVTGLMLCV